MQTICGLRCASPPYETAVQGGVVSPPSEPQRLKVIATRRNMMSAAFRGISFRTSTLESHCNGTNCGMSVPLISLRTSTLESHCNGMTSKSRSIRPFRLPLRKPFENAPFRGRKRGNSSRKSNKNKMGEPHALDNLTLGSRRRDLLSFSC